MTLPAGVGTPGPWNGHFGFEVTREHLGAALDAIKRGRATGMGPVPLKLTDIARVVNCREEP